MAEDNAFSSLTDKELESNISQLSLSLAGAKIERARRHARAPSTSKASIKDKKLAGLLGISLERVGFVKAILAEAEKLGE
jgi:hypothetical protein